MHAVIVTFSLDPTRTEQQQINLHERIIPTVRQTPGFLAGYWTRDHATNMAHNVILFESEETAHDFSKAVEQNAEMQAAAGVSFQGALITEVVGHAQK